MERILKLARELQEHLLYKRFGAITLRHIKALQLFTDMAESRIKEQR